MHYFKFIIVDYLRDTYDQVKPRSGGPAGAIRYWVDLDVETVGIRWSWDVVANRKLDKEEQSLHIH